MKLGCIWLATALADKISFNRLGNNLFKHIHADTSMAKNLGVEIKLQLVEFMLNHENIINAKNLLNRVQTQKASQTPKYQSRLEKYLKYE